MSAESEALARYYNSVQRGLLTRGLLRTDGGGTDTPFSSRDLAQNFLRIAFFQEYQDVGGRLVARENASRLQRWTKPVRLSIDFGSSVPIEVRERDRQQIARFAARLTRVTGHPVTVSDTAPNFHVLVVNEPERRALAPRLRRLVPGISNASLAHMINLPRDTYCAVFTTDGGNNSTPDTAVAVIRGEHPSLLRTACLHEEIAQGLGLPNDSPRARPSIFNDDEEFGLLTTHDELLLQMLYDRRLRPGMTEEEARPIVNQIAAELTGSAV
ncbi:DUF2927 domain-containing protein [Aliiroseovarius sp.]|uniref:DUF2927 domain-containing protein n=1 Tax=Aliiroseovarius sp. TaxID=1872442 RepID=UPI00262F8C98|nr:DUF2927 domain-containing protein [Aliiroseovarius sp.]